MSFVVGNPKSHSIMRDASFAYANAGASVQGQLPHWIACSNDPGKRTFWGDALIACGMPAPEAYRLVEDLNRVKRGW